MKRHLGEPHLADERRLWTLCGAETKTKSRKDVPVTTDIFLVTCGSCLRSYNKNR